MFSGFYQYGRNNVRVFRKGTRASCLKIHYLPTYCTARRITERPYRTEWSDVTYCAYGIQWKPGITQTTIPIVYQSGSFSNIHCVHFIFRKTQVIFPPVPHRGPLELLWVQSPILWMRIILLLLNIVLSTIHWRTHSHTHTYWYALFLLLLLYGKIIIIIFVLHWHSLVRSSVLCRFTIIFISSFLFHSSPFSFCSFAWKNESNFIY